MFTNYIVIITLLNSYYCSGKVYQHEFYRNCPTNSSFGDPMPDYIDWREKNAVSPVKDQLQCEACWVFSTIATIESHLKIYLDKEVELSSQFLLDCDPDKNGCDKCASVLKAYSNIVSVFGGVPESKDYFEYDGKYYGCRCQPTSLDRSEKKDTSLVFKQNNHKIENRNIYDFHHWIENILKEDKTKENGFRPCPRRVLVTGYKRVQPDEIIMLQYLINNGPLTAGINSKSMETYDGKPDNPYIDEPTPEKCPPDELNHSVEIVGHNTFMSGDRIVHYWIIKNSWGTSWGDKGFYYLVAGKNACGISSDVSFPYVK